DLLPYDVELPLERFLVPDFSSVGADEDLPDRRHDRARLRAAFLGLDRHHAPAEELQALLADRALEDLLALVQLVPLGRQEHHAGAVLAGLGQLDAERLTFLLQELVRDLQRDAGAVAGQRVAAASASVLEVLEDLETLLDDVARALAAH